MASDFSSTSTRTLSTAVHIFGASILAFCFATRLKSSHLSFRPWRNIPWARWCTILVFIDSWLFHVWASLLIHGYGLNRNPVTCRMGIYLCIVIYCSSKVLIYSFLIERIYVVWPHEGTRLSSKAFCACMLMMAGYIVVAFVMLVGRNTFFNENDNCIIGLKPFASIPLLSYDLFLNIVFTLMFLWPLQQAHFRDIRLRKIASRTLIAALVALTTSSINIAVLTLKHGFELGWVCLASCGLDVTINALVIFAVTDYKPENSTHYYFTSMNFTIPIPSNVLSTQPISVMVHAPSQISLPAPVQSKHDVHRMSAVISCEPKMERDSEFPESDPDMIPSLFAQAQSQLVGNC